MVSRWQRAGAAGAVVLAIVGAASPATAQVPDAPGAPSESPAGSADRLDAAKRLFREGVRLLKIEDYEGALDAFLQSKAQVPSVHNTYNAAICFTRLGRDDEALEMYEDLLLNFAPSLTEEEQKNLGPTMVALRRKVGGVDLTANTAGRVFIDGRERARLPLTKPLWVLGGAHLLRIVAPGYELFRIPITIVAGATASIAVQLNRRAPVRTPVRVPPPEPPRGPAFVGLFTGYAGGSSLGSDAEESCSGICPVNGFITGARTGYHFDFGLSLELMGGYMLVESRFSRTKYASFHNQQVDTTFPISYDLEDDLVLRGAFIGTGVSYRGAIGSRIGIVARASAGLVAAQSVDPVVGTATTTGAPAPVLVSYRDQVLQSQPVFVMPEIGMDAQWGGFHAGVSLGIAVFLLDGPRFNHRQTGSTRPGCAGGKGTVECAPNSSIIEEERAYGPFWLWVPQLEVAYLF